MKKEYTKPFLAVESFQLDAAIAASCSTAGKVSLNHGLNNCTLIEEVPGEEIFGGACVEDIYNFNTEGNDGFCYHAFAYDAKELYLNS